jgi:hypothetical protein
MTTGIELRNGVYQKRRICLKFFVRDYHLNKYFSGAIVAIFVYILRRYRHLGPSIVFFGPSRPLDYRLPAAPHEEYGFANGGRESG